MSTPVNWTGCAFPFHNYLPLLSGESFIYSSLWLPTFCTMLGAGGTKTLFRFQQSQKGAHSLERTQTPK